MGLETLALVGSIAGAGAAVVGTVSANRNAKKQVAAQQQQQEVSARHERMQAIRQAQIQRAAAAMTSVGAGSSDSSGASGGIGSIGSQLGTNMGYASQMTGLSRMISSFGQRAQTAQGIAGLGMSAFNALGGFGNMFGGNQAVGPQGSPYPTTPYESR